MKKILFGVLCAFCVLGLSAPVMALPTLVNEQSIETEWTLWRSNVTTADTDGTLITHINGRDANGLMVVVVSKSDTSTSLYSRTNESIGETVSITLQPYTTIQDVSSNGLVSDSSLRITSSDTITVTGRSTLFYTEFFNGIIGGFEVNAVTSGGYYFDIYVKKD